ncbi:hypothetical protein, conserved [Trypanosoma brucei gambiense DAL972]|uniref:Uncharacterized protein n=1 Tax=Trypanosoma brucei gambiense (strain MHOM/CI/86/DAL972) TaxID=679716 RepID=C9ZLE6_TRYB9|nr:hypothetical protein, conserved [Trypanosoma brucei gambiense DAL972]CBH10155.1 hypothetical protein, conserved [Trypanosoma brucei gambiense DAL972]|eukprot:XP_011772445.1 hypothetical protein, conserved [Trypanosoma brucei gambiense DAL972]
MQIATVPSWNQLLPEKGGPRSDGTHAMRNVQGGEVLRGATSPGSTCGGHAAANFPLSDWEAEAVRRYRALKKGDLTAHSVTEYLHSSPIHGTLLQLVLHSKIVHITDWYERAGIVADWFSGGTPAPLCLLPSAVVHLVGSHQLTPSVAAGFLLRVAKLLLNAKTVSRAADSEKGQRSNVCVFTADGWSAAEVLQRSVYDLQEAGLLTFEHFSSFFLRAALDKILIVGEEPELLLIPMCFLIRRCQKFASDGWINSEERLRHLNRMCDTAGGLPTHIATTLTAII